MVSKPNQDPPREIRVDTGIASEFERLIQRGREILISCGWNGARYAAFRPGGVEVLKFRSQTVSVIRRAFGENRGYLARLRACVEDRRAPERGYHVAEFVDVLECAFEDFQREILFRSPADLLDELSGGIELAEMLSNAGCHEMAIRNAARYLEKILRTLGRAHEISDAEMMSLDELNDALRAQDVLSEPVHLRIAACLQIERDLSGPKGSCIPEGELAEMVAWIRDFGLAHRVVMSNVPRG